MKTRKSGLSVFYAGGHLGYDAPIQHTEKPLSGADLNTNQINAKMIDGFSLQFGDPGETLPDDDIQAGILKREFADGEVEPLLPPGFDEDNE